MAERLLKVSLKNMTASEVSEEARSLFTAHFSHPKSPALLLSDGTAVRVIRASEFNLLHHVSEPGADR